MPSRKRQLSPQDESDVVPPSKKAKLNVTPPPSTSILSPAVDVVNEAASDSASTLSGEGAPLEENSPNPNPSAVQSTSNNPAAGQARDVDSSNLATPPEQKYSPSSESHTAPADEGPILPGALALRPGRMWKPDLIDQSLDVALKSYPRPNDYVDGEDISWHSTNGNVAPVSFSNLVKLASVDLTFLHKLLALVNHQTWKQKNRNIHNPLFAEPASFAFKSDYNHIADGKIVAHFGLVCLVSTSSISQREGAISLAPLRQMWLALGRFLATLGSEVVIGFQTSDGDLTMARPPFTNGGGSPSKAGRDPAPDSSPSVLIHDLTSRSSDSFDVSGFKARYGDFKINEVAFVTFTARKWDQDAKALWLFTPVRFVSLSG